MKMEFIYIYIYAYIMMNNILILIYTVHDALNVHIIILFIYLIVILEKIFVYFLTSYCILLYRIFIGANFPKLFQDFVFTNIIAREVRALFTK